MERIPLGCCTVMAAVVRAGAGLAGVEPPPAFFLGATFALAGACFFAGFLAAALFVTFFADALAFVLAGRFVAGRFLVFAIEPVLPHTDTDE